MFFLRYFKNVPFIKNALSLKKFKNYPFVQKFSKIPFKNMHFNFFKNVSFYIQF